MLFEDLAIMVVLFGVFVVVPVVALMLRHQKNMTELIHKRQEPPDHTDQVLSRLDAMQQQMDEMKNRLNELLLQRHEESPAPKVGDQFQE